VPGKDLLRTVISGGVEHRRLHVGALRLDTLQRRVEKLDVIADRNRDAERES
jgi:hypothetical protein